MKYLIPDTPPRFTPSWYFLILGLLVGGGFMVFSLMGFLDSGCSSGSSSSSCGGNNTNTNTTTSDISSQSPAPAGPSGRITTPDKVARENEAVQMDLKGTWGDTGASGQLVWTPPNGATNLTFPGKQPNPGGPPYVFNVTVAEANAGVPVGFTTPPTNETITLVSTLEVVVGDAKSYSTMEQTLFPKLGGDKHPDGLPPAFDEGRTLDARLDNVNVWTIERWVDVTETTLTKSFCQQLVEIGQSPDNFLVWKVPVVEPPTGESAQLPAFVGGAKTPNGFIVANSNPNTTLPMQVLPQATIWANQNLPATTGYRWMAVGGDPEASVTCADYTNTPSSWSFLFLTYFDLSSQPNDCANCVLQSYSCYRTASTQADPQKVAFQEQIARILSPGGFSQTLAGEITCLGPNQSKLVNGANWRFEAYSYTLAGVPGDQLDAVFWIDNTSSSPQTFNLNLSSNLTGATWLMYEDMNSAIFAPNFSKPVTSPVTVPANTYMHIIHLVTTVPTNATGQAQVTLSASSAGMNPPEWTGITNLFINGLSPIATPTNYAVALTGQTLNRDVKPGDLLTYNLTVSNPGSKALSGLVLSDPIPVNTTYESCSGGDTCSLSGGSAVWNLASLNSGASQSFVLNVRVGSGLAVGTLINNTGYQVQTTQGASKVGADIRIFLINKRFLFPLIIK